MQAFSGKPLREKPQNAAAEGTEKLRAEKLQADFFGKV